MNNGRLVSIIIPTKNRPLDLNKAVRSILESSSHPDELLIVDQSNNDSSKISVQDIMKDRTEITLTYIHDPTISGLVAAKDCGARTSIGDLICFLEDDIALEPRYLDEIIRGFNRHPNMAGCCGVITNPPYRSVLRKIIFNIFHFGIFFDPRPTIFENYKTIGPELIPSRMISGGLSAWRRDVLEAIPFDVTGGFHAYEDIEYSTRVAEHFKNQLFINPNARLEHHCSAVNRDAVGPGQERKVIECFKYFKKRRNDRLAVPSFLWLLIGFLIDSIFKSASMRTLDPIKHYLIGLKRCVN